MGAIDNSKAADGSLRNVQNAGAGHVRINPQQTLNEDTLNELAKRSLSKIEYHEDDRENKKTSGSSAHIDVHVDGIKDMTRGTFI